MSSDSDALQRVSDGGFLYKHEWTDPLKKTGSILETGELQNLGLFIEVLPDFCPNRGGGGALVRSIPSNKYIVSAPTHPLHTYARALSNPFCTSLKRVISN